MLAWGHPTCAHPNAPTIRASLDSASSRESSLSLGWTQPGTLETSCGRLVPTCEPAGANLWAGPGDPSPSQHCRGTCPRVPVHSCPLSSASSHHTPGHTTYMYTHAHHGHLCTDRQAVCLSESGLPWVERRKGSVAQTPQLPTACSQGSSPN